MSEKECYKKIYGDLIYYVEYYKDKKRLLTDAEINYAIRLANCYPRTDAEINYAMSLRSLGRGV